jgi:raffinose/stachyose/melibiose transport system substrate-binding protein
MNTIHKEAHAMKKVSAILILVLASAGLLFANGQSEKSSSSSTMSAAKPAPSVKKINMFQFKVEIAPQLQAMAKEYQKETGVEVDVQTVGGGSDYGAALKSQFASGNEPDIFNIGGPSDVNDWIQKLAPLTNQSWVKNAVKGTLDGVTKDGQIYGQPMDIEGYGLITNVDILKKAGLDPAKITSFTDLKNAVNVLESKKKELGLTSVFAYTTKETWVTGLHTANIAFANQPDPQKFVAELNKGTTTMAGNKDFKDWLNLLNLILDHSQPNLNSASYDDQVTLFATGGAAFIEQGDWTNIQMMKINPKLNLTVIPLFINDSATSNSIPVGVPMYWAVNKNKPAAEVQAAKDFLSWMVNSKTGQDYIVNKFKFIPAFTNIDASKADPLLQSILTQAQKRGSIPWMFMSFPTNVGMNGFGADIQKYYAKQLTGDQLLAQFDKNWQNAVKK